MRKYLTNLIEEKGRDLEDALNIPGHIGLTFNHLIDFIEGCPEHHPKIRATLVEIDYRNGDVFHFLKHLGQGMVAACGY